MVASIRGSSAVVGVGLINFHGLPGMNHMEIMAQAVEKAIADAGIHKNEIDGILVCQLCQELLTPLTIAEYFGLNQLHGRHQHWRLRFC